MFLLSSFCVVLQYESPFFFGPSNHWDKELWCLVKLLGKFCKEIIYKPRHIHTFTLHDITNIQKKKKIFQKNDAYRKMVYQRHVGVVIFFFPDHRVATFVFLTPVFANKLAYHTRQLWETIGHVKRHFPGVRKKGHNECLNKSYYGKWKLKKRWLQKVLLYRELAEPGGLRYPPLKL